jgi:hypothetical protein
MWIERGMGGAHQHREKFSGVVMSGTTNWEM